MMPIYKFNVPRPKGRDGGPRGLATNLPARLRMDEVQAGGNRIVRRIRDSLNWHKIGMPLASRGGLTILLTVLILSALLSISISIYTVILGELRLSGELADSFVALYAADRGLEAKLYDDRSDGTPVCTNPCGPITDPQVLLANGACYVTVYEKKGQTTSIIATGEYRCQSPLLPVKRAFQVTY